MNGIAILMKSFGIEPDELKKTLNDVMSIANSVDQKLNLMLDINQRLKNVESQLSQIEIVLKDDKNE